MDHFLNLRIFVGLVELEIFSRTALELGMSAATVTTRLVQLETHLGVSLVQRNTRGLKITEEGQELYVGARQLLRDLQKLEARFSNVRDVAKGRLRISLPPIIASCMLLPELTGFLSAHPDVHVELDISTRFVDLGKH